MLTFDPTNPTFFELNRNPNRDETEIFFRFRQNPPIDNRSYDLLIILKSKVYGPDYEYNSNKLLGILYFLRDLNPASIYPEENFNRNCSASPNAENPSESDILDASIPLPLNWVDVIDEAIDLLE